MGHNYLFEKVCRFGNNGRVSFHLGKPILVMFCRVAGGRGDHRRRVRQSRTRKWSSWIFAESHQRSYIGADHSVGETPAHKYTRTTGNSLDVVLMNHRAEDVRLLSIFNTHGRGQLVPDAAEVEISNIGKFFRPPVSDIGFLPLNDFLKRSGWYDQIVKARFAPWSKKGVIFGVPHDLHPTAIAYRKDLFDEAGVDLAAAKTWPEFHRRLPGSFVITGSRTDRPRWAIGLSQDILRQHRHHASAAACESDRRSRIASFSNDPHVADTLRVFADMVAGPDPAGTDFNPAPGLKYRDLANGDVCAMICAGLGGRLYQDLRPDAAGKLAMMPLPKFDPTDSPTASWGGTMIGIPRDCKDPEASWKLIESLYLDHDAVAYRRQSDEILPPIRKYWNDDVYQHGDPFFYNAQNVNQLLIQMAEELPMRYVTPFTIVAQQLLSDVLNRDGERIDAGTNGESGSGYSGLAG